MQFDGKVLFLALGEACSTMITFRLVTAVVTPDFALSPVNDPNIPFLFLHSRDYEEQPHRFLVWIHERKI